MSCKCGAKTLDEHREIIANGYGGHVYGGPFWRARGDSWYDTPDNTGDES